MPEVDIGGRDVFEALVIALMMLFARLKRILGLGRLRLRGPCGANDEFCLAATAQNLRKLAYLIPMPKSRSQREGHGAPILQFAGHPSSADSNGDFFNGISPGSG